MPWPRLREELALYQGPRLADGQPSWVLHDPVRNLFFRLDWLTFECLSRWSLADPEAILAAIERETTLSLGPEDLRAVQCFVSDNQLVIPEDVGGSVQLAARLRKQKSS